MVPIERPHGLVSRVAAAGDAIGGVKDVVVVFMMFVMFVLLAVLLLLVMLVVILIVALQQLQLRAQMLLRYITKIRSVSYGKCRLWVQGRQQANRWQTVGGKGCG